MNQPESLACIGFSQLHWMALDVKKQPENLGCFVKVVRTERTYVCPISAPFPSLLNYIHLHINTV